MAITVVVNTDQTTYQVGEVITVDVDVQGEFEGSTRTVTITAQVTVDGAPHTGTEDITVTAQPADIDYDSVTGDGLSFVQDGVTPSRWRAVAA
jgi:hypothetical protein